MGDAADWARLTALLDDDAEVRQAVTDATGEPGGDPWGALLDGLDDAGALAYLDPDDTGMELVEALVRLPRVFRLQPDLDEANDTDDLAEAMAAADAELAGHGHRLLRLAEPDSDAHPLVVVPAAAVDEVLRLAGTLGQDVSAVG